MTEKEMRQLYNDLQEGDRVEVTHHIKIGSKQHTTSEIGTVVSKDRRQAGSDCGYARNWDDRYWFDHLILKKEDGELTALVMDEFIQLKRLKGI